MEIHIDTRTEKKMSIKNYLLQEYLTHQENMYGKLGQYLKTSSNGGGPNILAVLFVK